jgi:hypothetical protein
MPYIYRTMRLFKFAVKACMKNMVRAYTLSIGINFISCSPVGFFLIYLHMCQILPTEYTVLFKAHLQ